MKKQTKQKIKETLTETILPILAVAGALTVAFIAPNAVKLFGALGEEYRVPRRSFRRSIRYMEKRGYIKRKGPKTSWEFTITPEGERILEKHQIEKLKIDKPKTWDQKWRMVVFDVPETMKRLRAEFRWKLYHLGFRYLNLSVWIYPFECRNEINAIAEYYDVGKYVRYVLVEDFDGSDVIKKKFNL